MPSFYNDDDWFNTEADFTGGEDTDDDVFEDNESFSSDTEEQSDGNEYYPIKQPVWKHVKVGGKCYFVSDMGRIRPHNSMFEVSKGLEDASSPYRTFTFVSEEGHAMTYYMHDIVWQAFNGPPPDGWEVKHTANETSRRKRHYSNSLSKLTIVPIRADTRPRVIFT